MEDFVGKDFLLELLDKDPNAITDEEKAVLFARKSYLTNEQLEKFGIEGEAPDVKEDDEDAEDTGDNGEGEDEKDDEGDDDEEVEEEPKPKPRRTRKKK